MNSVDNLCKWTDIVERAINTLWIDMRDLRGKAPMGEGDMFMLVEAMRAPKKTLGPIDSSMRSMGFLDEEVDEEATNVQRVMEASLDQLTHKVVQSLARRLSSAMVMWMMQLMKMTRKNYSGSALPF